MKNNVNEYQLLHDETSRLLEKIEMGLSGDNELVNSIRRDIKTALQPIQILKNGRLPDGINYLSLQIPILDRIRKNYMLLIGE